MCKLQHKALWGPLEEHDNIPLWSREVRHAGVQALAQLVPLLIDLRAIEWLAERKPGIFYKGGQAWLHFHEDGSDLFADLKVDGDWQRYRVNSQNECERLLVDVRQSP